MEWLPVDHAALDALLALLESARELLDDPRKVGLSAALRVLLAVLKALLERHQSQSKR